MPVVIVTAGATRNPIDAMRYISARSAGTTGIGLARDLTARGARVILLGSRETLLHVRPGDVEKQVEYGSTRDLMSKMEEQIRANPGAAVVHSAAVGDYEAVPRTDKIPSNLGELTLTLRPTPKIVDLIKTWSPRSFLVSFKAAGPGTTQEELHTLCENQRIRTKSDLVLGNVLGNINGTTAICDEGGFTPLVRYDAMQQIVERVVEAIRS